MRAGARRHADDHRGPGTDRARSWPSRPVRCSRRARSSTRGAPPATPAGSTRAPTSWPAKASSCYAVAAGTITKVYDVVSTPRTGNGLIITKDDKTYFFYGHMSALAPEITVGAKVAAGQLVGYVGHTGNTTVSHLHLEIHPGGGDPINPYATLLQYGAC